MSKEAHRTAVDLVDDVVRWGDEIPLPLGKVSFEELRALPLIHLSVWKCVEIAGETSNRLLRLAPHIGDEALRGELRAAAETRNRLSHGYVGVDLGVLWSTSTLFVPALVSKVSSSDDSFR